MKNLLWALCLLCFLSVTVMAVTVIKTSNNEKSFVPPVFDPDVIKGIPDVPEELGYSSLEVEEGFKVYVCGNLTATDVSVDVYFTSPESNTVWLLLRITDEKGTILGETGVVRPGEYVKALKLNEKAEGEGNVKLKIIAYSPETYTSMGTVTLNTNLKINEQG